MRAVLRCVTKVAPSLQAVSTNNSERPLKANTGPPAQQKKGPENPAPSNFVSRDRDQANDQRSAQRSPSMSQFEPSISEVITWSEVANT